MKRSTMLLYFAIGMLLPVLPAQAQDVDATPLPPVQLVEPMETVPSAPHVSDSGFTVLPGWNLGAAVDATGVYDSNPASQEPSKSDTAQRYSGNVALSYLGPHTVYQANYLPSFNYYRTFSGLDSNNQEFRQSLWHQFNAHTGMTWRLELRKFPSWGGSTFSNSAFGSLLMQLSGLNALSLVSKETTATSSWALDHQASVRSRFHLSVSGGVAKYAHSSSNQFLNLLTAADSSTWYGQTGLSYDYQLAAHRSIGVEASNSYYLFTYQNYSMTSQSVVLRYSEIINSHWVVSASAGPELREIQHSQGKHDTGLNLKVEATRKNSISAFHAAVTESYSVGEAQGSLTSWYAMSSFEHALGKRCFAGVFGTYQRSQTLASGPLGTGVTQSITPAAEFGVRLSRNLIAFGNYGMSVQKGTLTQQQTNYRQQLIGGVSFTVDRLYPF